MICKIRFQYYLMKFFDLCKKNSEIIRIFFLKFISVMRFLVKF